MRRSTALSLRAVLPAAAIALVPALYGLAPPADAADTGAEPRPDTTAESRPGDAAAAAPVCGSQDSTEFPIATSLHDGPDHYARGGAWRTWRLELRNTTDTGCTAVHPIAVLVDRAHALRPEHIRFEFLDPAADGGTWRPVSFETTDQDENLGVFDDHFKGFTVPAGEAVDVQVRTRFGDDAPRGKVTTNVIAVQRREDDGDWVGQSNDYEFSVDDAGTEGTEGTDVTGDAVGTDDETGSDATAHPKDPKGTDGASVSPSPSASPPSTRSLTPPRAKPASPSPSPSPSESSGTGLKESSPAPPSADTEPKPKPTPTGTDGTDDSGDDEDTGVSVDPSTPPGDTGTDTATEDPGTGTATEDPGTGTEDPGTTDPGDTGTGTEDPGTGTEDPGLEDPGTTDPGDTGDTGTGTEDPGLEDPGTGTEDPGLEDPGTTDPGDTGDTGTGTEDP
ncbi:hypothetical protein, partial [Streptomyces sp. NPDC048636]|uniref:hypothetical protein n=1 Tax=Streptomyces sp. NPDC048636 TaxID=3155762 RepID=UPI003443B37D